MPRIVKEGARAVREHPTRRGSDYPHPFKPNVGFRTCVICGLARNHKIHSAKELAVQ